MASFSAAAAALEGGVSGGRGRPERLRLVDLSIFQTSLASLALSDRRRRHTTDATSAREREAQPSRCDGRAPREAWRACACCKFITFSQAATRSFFIRVSIELLAASSATRPGGTQRHFLGCRRRRSCNASKTRLDWCPGFSSRRSRSGRSRPPEAPPSSAAAAAVEELIGHGSSCKDWTWLWQPG